jgi:hypothetical protein
MSTLEKRLAVFALFFVVVYLGAVGLTLHSRLTDSPKELRIESTRTVGEERHLMMAELLLPMLILLAVAGSFLVVKKKRAKLADRLDEEDPEETHTHLREG